MLKLGLHWLGWGLLWLVSLGTLEIHVVYSNSYHENVCEMHFYSWLKALQTYQNKRKAAKEAT